ncbi:membrane protein [Neobacillus dielmonensis]|uniref:membrane protein n=1 Tax=Neobacillus dielmonensis TaxID=1347369 RepID=UPI0005A7606E|nr:membrane protein [Neobacillus dielmonensis]
MSQMLALVIVVFILLVGDWVAIRTKAWVPSMFISAVLFLIGYWTFFPKEIVSIAGIPSVVATMLMYLLITNMGTLLSLQELKAQWKTILIAITGILGIVVFLLSIGTLIFGFKTMVVAVPPLVGGVVSALIMSEGAKTAGLASLSVFAIVIYVMQGFAGYPLTSIMLKKEGKRLLEKYRNGELMHADQVQASAETAATVDFELKLFKSLPEKYNTEFFKFFRLAVVAFLAYLVSTLLAPVVSVSPFVLCLLFGIIGKSIGFLEKQALQKANGFGFAMMGLMLFIFDGLKQATPSMMMEIIWPLIGTIVIGVIGMYVFSFIAGKVLKVSKEMAFAVSLTALYGFPADFIITNEVIKSLTNDEKEKEVLTSHMLPPMLVGGFITVTIVSVILAGIFVKFL